MRHPICPSQGWRHAKNICSVGLVSLLLACSSAAPVSKTTGPKEQSATECKDDITAVNKVALSGISQSIDQDKAHAALAQLDALNLQVPRVQLLRADALRRVGRTQEARQLYEELLPSCVSGPAHHGLGLLHAGERSHEESLRHLQRARALMPTDAQVRNDLGYAFLLRRSVQEARFEFMTAIELAPDLVRARYNLYMLASLQREDGLRATLARQWALDASTEKNLQESASRLPLIVPTEPAKAGASTP